MTEISLMIGKSIRQKRLSLGLSQDNLAWQAEIDRSYIGRIERGEANLTVCMLYRIAAVLACHPKDLLPDEK